MNQDLRLAYLRAMEIPLWVRRGRDCEEMQHASSGTAATLRLGPGSGGVLLICANAKETAGLLAADISRASNGEPVWAWPHEGDGACDAREAIEDSSFTTVVVFGPVLARRLFGEPAPGTIGQARLISVPGFDELARSAAARRGLWKTMVSGGLA